ncbi:LysR family transcriptional regulator [Granulosicoccus antarcticus]|uniref:HTH-type transcriptional regulator CysL n=1 Tax=Granulosicoccus antarcticus IMCC3135 TaxID=1192854 RepID=A0A2Z2NJF8_9GAMM|nr:LysR family transcriptional regulator [Granulosicoccus antarcticus]ASJ70635.1 HTH-type transcriptional regulator CysL [Granulosicoccus antarcticus IMCC3135]
MNNWDDIRYFLAVTRSGSVSGAAKVLGVNHSTVTRRIQSFEAKHGVELFIRQRDGYEMTEAADTILEQAQQMEEQSQQLSRTLYGRDSRLEGPISLTMTHDMFEYCLAEDLAQFQRKHPGIELNLIVSPGLRNLNSREADLAIRLTQAPPDYLVGHEVAGLQHGIYSSRQRPPDEPLGIVLWRDQEARPDWVAEHFPKASIALRVDNLSSMYAAVRAGFGVARMHCYMPDSLDHDDVIKLPISLPPSDWSVWVLSHTDLRKTRRVQLCRKFLLDRLKEKRGLFEGEQSVS